MNDMSSYHVGVSAEAFAAGQFARLGCDVLVQYGANQPEYDLIIVKDRKTLKVSVKGSKTGSWGLTQSFKKGRTYHEAVDFWLKRHSVNTIFCFVQFMDTGEFDLPRMFLAWPEGISQRLKETRKGIGETILYENKVWTKRASAYGSIDKIPENWIFSYRRLKNIFSSKNN